LGQNGQKQLSQVADQLLRLGEWAPSETIKPVTFGLTDDSSFKKLRDQRNFFAGGARIEPSN
jgi:hypothetical protein